MSWYERPAIIKIYDVRVAAISARVWQRFSFWEPGQCFGASSVAVGYPGKDFDFPVPVIVYSPLSNLTFKPDNFLADLRADICKWIQVDLIELMTSEIAFRSTYSASFALHMDCSGACRDWSIVLRLQTINGNQNACFARNTLSLVPIGSTQVPQSNVLMGGCLYCQEYNTLVLSVIDGQPLKGTFSFSQSTFRTYWTFSLHTVHQNKGFPSLLSFGS